ncbi:MAG: FKBP-type peptidyl-prolyl cis-trans isomerase [Fimbriimonadales bacterium]
MPIHALALAAALFIQTPDKLQIKDVAVGTGRAAQANDVVTVEYTGTLIDGKEFDSSKGKPPYLFTLGQGQVIKGWDEGVAGMKVGGDRELTIPPDLGYGDQGKGIIPPKSTLKFDVKLLRIDRAGDKQELEQTIVKPGSGAAVVEGDMIDVHYLGTFLNGVKFDSSYDRKKPLQILAGHARLIKGFSQGLEGIKEGEKRRLVIPPSLGYGNSDRGPIPGRSTLVFEIEVVKVTPKAEVAKQIEAIRKKLSIQELAPGTGPGIKNGDTASIHVSLTVAGGKTLFNTRDRGQPESYPVGAGQLGQGFDAALVGMKTGQKRKITVPPDLAFGAEGAGNGSIPPNATIVFEVEVVKINP